jgi:Copper type II ascorbate-dependent monooxygenase, C-terminal domain
MRFPVSVAFALSICVGCSGSGTETPAPGGPNGSFNPAPPPAGYTRITSPVITGIEPGADITVCQYVQAPTDRDIDILDAQGFQSPMGHHAIAFATTAIKPVGTSGPCGDEDNLTGSFLGGIGGEGGAGVKLPEGVAFRLPKGSGIMLNVHFLNTTNKTIDGQSVVDVKFAEADPSRKIAGFFVNGTTKFKVSPNAKAQATAECPIGKEMDFIFFTNHMHDYGARAITNLVRDGALAAEVVHEDPVWTYEMQFAAIFSKWQVSAPLHLVPGDKLVTDCEWMNTTAEDVVYPREMCFGVGYFLTDGKGPSPGCFNGMWFER